jgi:hypothetical protein
VRKVPGKTGLDTSTVRRLDAEAQTQAFGLATSADTVSGSVPDAT